MVLSSRPELPVRLGFLDITKGTRCDIALHEVARPVIEHDIALYIQHELALVRARYSKVHISKPLPIDWPGQENVRTLIERATPLFIFAATMCRFIADPKGNPKSRLERVLDSPSDTLGAKLDQTYMPVLEQLLADQHEGDAG